MKNPLEIIGGLIPKRVKELSQADGAVEGQWLMPGDIVRVDQEKMSLDVGSSNTVGGRPEWVIKKIVDPENPICHLELNKPEGEGVGWYDREIQVPTKYLYLVRKK